MIKITDNLSLRLFTQEDVPAIFNIIDSQREYMREWLPFVDMMQKIEDAEKAMQTMQDPENPSFCILYNDKVVGLIGFKETKRIVRKTEIGYWLSQDFQQKGIMTQAVTKLLEYAFMVMKMNRVIVTVAVGNHKSRNIPNRIGFVEEGTERESDLLSGGIYTDIVVYSMLRKEYLEKIENGDIKIPSTR